MAIGNKQQKNLIKTGDVVFKLCKQTVRQTNKHTHHPAISKVKNTKYGNKHHVENIS